MCKCHLNSPSLNSSYIHYELAIQKRKYVRIIIHSIFHTFTLCPIYLNIVILIKTGDGCMNEAFFPTFFNCYFIALGIMFGGALIGGLAAFITGEPLFTEIAKISSRIRIWAIIAAIGGTFDTVYSFERGFLDGGMRDLFKQFLWILSAMGGAKTAALIITWLTQEHIS